MKTSSFFQFQKSIILYLVQIYVTIFFNLCLFIQIDNLNPIENLA